MNQSSLNGKRLWRESLKSALQQGTRSESVKVLQERVCAHLCEYLKNQTGLWAGFQALPEEPDLSVVYQQMSHLAWAFPRIEGTELQFHACENFVKGSFGILEPAKDSPVVACEKLQGILVPGLGFNKKGRRLGRGRGFYDRALAEYQGFKIGVAFGCQVVGDDLPAEDHDVLMNALVTETEFIVVQAS